MILSKTSFSAHVQQFSVRQIQTCITTASAPERAKLDHWTNNRVRPPWRESGHKLGLLRYSEQWQKARFEINAIALGGVLRADTVDRVQRDVRSGVDYEIRCSC